MPRINVVIFLLTLALNFIPLLCWSFKRFCLKTTRLSTRFNQLTVDDFDFSDSLQVSEQAILLRGRETFLQELMRKGMEFYFFIYFYKENLFLFLTQILIVRNRFGLSMKTMYLEQGIAISRMRSTWIVLWIVLCRTN